MRGSGDLVKGPWRYAEIAGASHWIPLDAPEEVSALLLEWFRASRLPPVQSRKPS
jgi:pimeloyl-ACP methyl ester carboxylesterase